MNHRGKLIFVIVCGIIGAILSLALLPPVVDGFGQRMFENLRESSRNPDEEPPRATRRTVTKPKPVEEAPDVSDGSPAPIEGISPDVTEEEPETREIVIPPPVDDPVAPEVFPTSPFAVGLFGFILGMVIGGFALRQWERASETWDKSPSGDKITLILGAFTGVIAGILVSMPFLIALQGRPEGAILTMGLVVGCSAAMIYLLRSLGPYLPWETSSVSRRTGLQVLDTNVLIDGRVYDLIRTGFLGGDLYVPQFVLLELQHIADSSDGMRRQRGRRGLEVLNRIRSEFDVEVGSRDRYAGTDKDQVDTRLMKLCKALGADLVSNDFNLNRTAAVQDIRVLNINDLALALRPNVLPGELLSVQVMKEGNQTGQGVGYLDDGTMVVVEGGASLIGAEEVPDVVVTQVIQTERGKMIFADANNGEHPPEPRRRSPRGQR